MLECGARKPPGAVRTVEKGRNENVSALFHVNFHVSAQAVTGRLARLSVVEPALVVFKVTPLPE